MSSRFTQARFFQISSSTDVTCDVIGLFLLLNGLINCIFFLLWPLGVVWALDSKNQSTSQLNCRRDLSHTPGRQCRIILPFAELSLTERTRLICTIEKEKRFKQLGTATLLSDLKTSLRSSIHSIGATCH